MKLEGRTLVFSTGRRECANNGIVGIGPDCTDLFEGYDGRFADDDENPLTRAEEVELADYMIDRWEEFRRHGARRGAT